MKRKPILITVAVFILCAAGIAALALWPSSANHQREWHRTRVIAPSVPGNAEPDLAWEGNLAAEESHSLKHPLNDGEVAISVLNYNFNGRAVEEQIVAFRSLSDAETPVCITFIAYDERARTYRRLWSLPTAATMPATVTMFTKDLIGDRSTCIIVTGMNAQREHTMTIFRKNPAEDRSRPFDRIAEIRMDGSIIVQESARTLAYQQGIARGQPFAITAYGRDIASENMLDQIEITYAFDPATGTYQQGGTTRVPRSQIEQRRLREILTGNPRDFENFINDLWYYVSPQGTIDRSQYVFFDPARREIVFFTDDHQQVFSWQRSNSTRYGLYISSQNISVTSLRRFLDIEMESLDSIRMRVFEDVRLRITASEPWDGSYRRAGSIRQPPAEQRAIQVYADTIYDSPMGRLFFFASGEYELSSGNSLTRGRYAFFRVGDRDLLELQPERGSFAAAGANGAGRQVFHITARGRAASEGTTGEDQMADNLVLSRVRLGSMGVQDLHEGQIILTRTR